MYSVYTQENHKPIRNVDDGLTGLLLDLVLSGRNRPRGSSPANIEFIDVFIYVDVDGVVVVSERLSSASI
jgi:hypothetical protein